MTITIRPAIQEDIPAIVNIEYNTLSSWNEAQIAAEFIRLDSIILVAGDHHPTTAIGWSCLRHVAPEAEVLKITVHPDYQRLGYGFLLLKELCQKAMHLNCKAIFLEVRSKNHPARNLYIKSGFSEQGIRKKYYQHPEDDAILYTKQMIP